MELSRMLVEALAFSLLVNFLLFLMMRFFDPRVWGYSDFPEQIKAGIPDQTPAEKRQALILGLPWLLFSFGFPIYRVWLLKSEMAAGLDFGQAFSILFAYFVAVSLIDLFVLDYWIISRLTPDFVVMQDTNPQDYKDLSAHYRLQILAVLPITLLLAFVAWILTIF